MNAARQSYCVPWRRRGATSSFSVARRRRVKQPSQRVVLLLRDSVAQMRGHARVLAGRSPAAAGDDGVAEELAEDAAKGRQADLDVQRVLQDRDDAVRLIGQGHDRRRARRVQKRREGRKHLDEVVVALGSGLARDARARRPRRRAVLLFASLVLLLHSARVPLLRRRDDQPGCIERRARRLDFLVALRGRPATAAAAAVATVAAAAAAAVAAAARAAAGTLAAAARLGRAGAAGTGAAWASTAAGGRRHPARRSAAAAVGE
mmetsp:Transcript_17451/g.62029  ORF Transcript_17451/g.62029 Transcript_17451/m.62029 type:complete len:262 (+) Transcript_17451:747-1532(+)